MEQYEDLHIQERMSTQGSPLWEEEKRRKSKDSWSLKSVRKGRGKKFLSQLSDYSVNVVLPMVLNRFQWAEMLILILQSKYFLIGFSDVIRNQVTKIYHVLLKNNFYGFHDILLQIKMSAVQLYLEEISLLLMNFHCLVYWNQLKIFYHTSNIT